jgi:hypothetical protein
MTPSGREKVKKKHPKLLSGLDIQIQPRLVDTQKIRGSLTALCKAFPEQASDFFVSLPEEVGDFLIPPAEAYIGVSVGLDCGEAIATGGLAIPLCAIGILSLYNDITNAIDTFNNCLAGQCGCKWYRPWCCLGRTGCWIAYIATMA